MTLGIIGQITHISRLWYITIFFILYVCIFKQRGIIEWPWDSCIFIKNENWTYNLTSPEKKYKKKQSTQPYPPISLSTPITLSTHTKNSKQKFPVVVSTQHSQPHFHSMISWPFSPLLQRKLSTSGVYCACTCLMYPLTMASLRLYNSTIT